MQARLCNALETIYHVMVKSQFLMHVCLVPGYCVARTTTYCGTTLGSFFSHGHAGTQPVASNGVMNKPDVIMANETS